MIAVYIFICLLISGFFSGLETGLLAANRMVIQEKKRKGIFYARAAEYLLKKPERLLGTTLIGYNIVNITAAVMFSSFIYNTDYAVLAWPGIIIMTCIFLIIGDIIPKSFFRRQADSIAVKLSPVLVGLYIIFLPIYFILNFFVGIILFITGQHISKREEMKSKKDLRFLVNILGERAGLTPSDKRIVQDIFDFRDQSAREVMVPFHKLPVLNIYQNIKDAIKLSLETGFRFIPVSAVRTDNMIGYIDTLDIMYKKDKSISELIIKAIFYPETKQIGELLLEMNQNNIQVVFLSDEYGGISGMVTPDKIVGEVVQRIPEKDYYISDIKKIGKEHFIVSGNTDMEDLANEIGITIKKGYNNTIGGFLCEKLGVIPEIDSVYEEGNYLFKVKDKDDKHIKEIEIIKNFHAFKKMLDKK